MTEPHLGTDIAVTNRDFVIGHDGDLTLTEGRACLAADLIARLETSKGTYWRHPSDGMGWDAFMQTEHGRLLLRAMEVAITRELELDPRLRAGYTTTSVNVRGNAEKITIEINAQPLDEGGPLNLVLGFDLATVTAEVLGG